MAAAMLTFGFGLGLAALVAQVEPAQATTAPAPLLSTDATTESTLDTPAPCAIEVLVDEERPAPSSTVLGTYLRSAAHGTMPNVAAAPTSDSVDLPPTGSSAR